MDAERIRAADWPHWPERGNGAARRDRLERRLFRDSEREAELVRAEEAIRQIEQAAAEKAAEVDRLEQAVAAIDVVEPAPAMDTGGHVLFAWTPRGYALHAGDGDLPSVGARLRLNGHEYAVAKLAPSPLPGDGRRCVYLEPLWNDSVRVAPGGDPDASV